MRGNSKLVLDILKKPMTESEISKTLIKKHGWIFPKYTLHKILYNLRFSGFIKRSGTLWKRSS
jgi:hypothetical protein